MTSKKIISAAVAAVASSVTAHAGLVQYTVIDLGPFEARAVNDYGQAAGFVYDGYAVRTTAHSAYNPLTDHLPFPAGGERMEGERCANHIFMP